MRDSPSTCSTRWATRISAQWDLSEDTYRTLTAVDSTVRGLASRRGMLIDPLDGENDAAKAGWRAAPALTRVQPRTNRKNQSLPGYSGATTGGQPCIKG